MTADRAQLGGFIDHGPRGCSTRSRRARCPGSRVVDGFALGGIYELALACRGIVATEKSTIGFPEIRLNIFPGLGGTQRMPRRSGLVNADDPIERRRRLHRHPDRQELQGAWTPPRSA